MHRTSAGFRPHLQGSGPKRRIRRLVAFPAKSRPCRYRLLHLSRVSPKIDFYKCQVESPEPREQKTPTARFFCSIFSPIGNTSPPPPACEFVTGLKRKFYFKVALGSPPPIKKREQLLKERRSRFDLGVSPLYQNSIWQEKRLHSDHFSFLSIG